LVRSVITAEKQQKNIQNSKAETMSNKENDRSTWAIGGGVIIGIGVGFFFLQANPLYFVGCIMLGLGIGLVLTTILSRRK